MDVSIFVCYFLIAYLGYRVLDFLARIPKVSKLDSRHILVTGCDSGFGCAVAKRLDSMGCQVFAACLTESGESSLKKSCSSRLKTINMDVSKPESVRKAFDAVKAFFTP